MLFYYLPEIKIKTKIITNAIKTNDIEKDKRENELENLKKRAIKYTRNCPVLSSLISSSFPIIETYLNHLINNNLNKKQTSMLLATSIKQIESLPSFGQIENYSFEKNDDCSTYAAIYLDNFYSLSKSRHKTKIFLKKIINIAENNYPIQKILCGIDNNINSNILSKELNTYYCELAAQNQNKPKFMKEKDFILSKDSISYHLANLYYKNKKINNLLNICRKMKGHWYENSCYNNVLFLVDETPASSKNQIIKELLRHWRYKYSSKRIKDKSTATRKIVEIYVMTQKTEALVSFCKKIKVTEQKELCWLNEQILGDRIYNSKNNDEAIKLYKDASHNKKYGYLAAQRLGDIYSNGVGVEKDIYEAIRWYENSLRSIENSLVRGNLGALYYKLNDYRNAYKHTKKAAVNGEAFFQCNVARMYAMGHGVIQDYKIAYAWSSVANAQGFSEKNDQIMCENLKKNLENLLKLEDRSLNELHKAKNLAKRYYALYAK